MCKAHHLELALERSLVSSTQIPKSQKIPQNLHHKTPPILMEGCNALTCSVDVGESVLHLTPTARQSHIVTSTQMHEMCSLQESKMAGWMQLRSLKQFNPYHLSPWPVPGSNLTKSTSSQEDFRAKMSVLQGARWVWSRTQEVLCGKRLCALPGSVEQMAQNGSSLKMSQESLGSKKMELGLSYLSFGSRGMIFDGQLFPAAILRPFIHETDGGVFAKRAMLPTPRTSDQQRPLNFLTLNQTMCMNFSGDMTSRENRHALLGHLNSQLSESLMGYPLDWTKTIE